MRFVATGPMHAPRSKIARIELNSTTEKNFTSCPAELYALCLCMRVRVCLYCVPCVSVCVAVSVCLFLFFSVFFRISCDFFQLFFLYFYCVGHKKERQTAISARTLSSPHSTMAIGIFCWPQAELSNERVIDTIINKYRETQQTSSTLS